MKRTNRVLLALAVVECLLFVFLASPLRSSYQAILEFLFTVGMVSLSVLLLAKFRRHRNVIRIPVAILTIAMAAITIWFAIEWFDDRSDYEWIAYQNVESPREVIICRFHDCGFCGPSFPFRRAHVIIPSLWYESEDTETTINGVWKQFDENGHLISERAYDSFKLVFSELVLPECKHHNGRS